MAATFVVEDGTGLATANSYLSVADAATYFETYSDPSAWDLAATSDRQTALRMATQWLDNRFLGRWKGTRANESQALAWPRSGVEDEDGYAVSSIAIPAKLKHATAEMALRFLADSSVSDLEADTDLASEVISERTKVDVIETEKRYGPAGKRTGTNYPKVGLLLAGLLRSGSYVTRIG